MLADHADCQSREREDHEFIQRGGFDFHGDTVDKSLCGAFEFPHEYSLDQ
ncbi:MAG TPA: hypothetical protein PLD79_02655 [Halothiobacillus sp.]|nr:hypothetical protein [Halothiobacillus sp.]